MTALVTHQTVQGCEDEIMSEDLIIGEDGLARPLWASSNSMLREYYDSEWGMPITDESGLYERLSLECFQSGLSWAIILSKREAFRRAFEDFDPEKVALFSESDFQRLVEDPSIVRNKLKIRATIANAQATLALRDEGGLADFIWSFKPTQTPKPATLAQIPTQSEESKRLAKGLKKRGFKFVGPTTMYALMEAVGMVDTHLLGSHRRGSSGIWPG